MSDVFDKPKDSIAPSPSPVPAPAPKKRKPMSEEAKAKARENLKKAREVRAAKNAGKGEKKKAGKGEKKEDVQSSQSEAKCKETLSDLMSQNDRLKSDLRKAVHLVREFEAKSKAKADSIAPKDVKMEFIPVETLEKFRRGWMYE
jgi:hypothetical protein